MEIYRDLREMDVDEDDGNGTRFYNGRERTRHH